MLYLNQATLLKNLPLEYVYLKYSDCKFLNDQLKLNIFNHYLNLSIKMVTKASWACMIHINYSR